MEVIQTNEDEQFIVEKKSEEIKDIPQSDSNPEPLLLSQTPIFFHHQPLETDLPKVPPPSLRELVTDCFVTILPTIPESLDQLDIPYVREHGVRDSIHLISDYFACQHYRNNLVQFWFLDILVDCIWKTQDEFRFQKNQQKIVLEWMMFIFKLITMDGMTKELMFDIFTEALMIAEEYIQSGGIKEPSPRYLFVLKEDPSLTETKSGESMLSTSGSALSLSNIPQSKQSNEYILIKYDEAVQVFKIPNKTVMIQDCVSSIEPPSDDGYQITDITHESKDNLSETPTTESSIEFYKPDMSTPPRFKSLSSLLKEEEKEESIQKIENPKHTDKGEWVNIPRREIITDCPSKLLSHTSTGNNVHEKGDLNGEIDSIMLDKEEVFKSFYKHNLWQLRNSFTNDSQIGWVPSIISKKEGPRQKRSNKHFDSSSNKNEENSTFINSCILLAVKEIIFDYFYSPFSFHLARYALKNPQFLITQDLNTEWHIPKDIKGDFKKPMPKKPKKEKKKKEKKEKKDKSSKKSKSTKSSKKDKKDKDKKSKDKKSKKSSEKKSKSSKKSDKSPKMTKEEKLELEQQKKEREELERQQFKEEEHRRFMFPLKEAVNDEFFAGIFPNYKPKRGKEVNKKTKDDKKSKKEKKSDKSSKKSKKK